MSDSPSVKKVITRKDLTFKNLQKKNKKFFKELGEIPTNLPIKTLEYIAKRTFETFNKRDKRLVDEAELYVMARSAHYEHKTFDFVEGIQGKIDKDPRHSWEENRRKVWNAFKSQAHDVYSNYISYMHRRGISGTYYWYDNVEFTKVEKSHVIAELDLENKFGYDMTAKSKAESLYIEYYYSGDIITAAYMIQRYIEK